MSIIYDRLTCCDLYDSDTDGLPDIFETAGMKLPTGEIISTKIDKPDSDDDGLLDGEEIAYTINDGYVKFKLVSNPTLADSDGDEVFDGKAQFYNGSALAPADPHPLAIDGPRNLWKRHIEEITGKEKTSTEYSDDYYKAMDFEWEIKQYGIFSYLDNNLIEFLFSCFSSFGSVALDFRYDDKHIALHSDTTQWQSIGGYNDFYDWIFDVGTSMSKLKLNFTCEGTDYVIWAWKGNYLNLGPGAEVGFYTQDDILDFVEENFHLEQWMVNESLPMTLSLYKVLGGKALDRTYYHWLPHEEQWWITGFVPDVYDQWFFSKFGLNWGDTITEDELLPLASINLSDKYNVFKNMYSPDGSNSVINLYEKTPYTLIFVDEETTVWLYW